MKQKTILLGIPFDDNSSYLKGAASAPTIIRKFMETDMCNNFNETGLCIDESVMTDYGNLDITNYEDIYNQLNLLQLRESKFLFLGGDHSITYPLIKYYKESKGNFTLLHFDAHADLYDQYNGNKYSHACPFARIMEEKLVDQLIQVGIRTLNHHQKSQAEKFGVQIIEMRNITDLKKLTINGPVYISLDIDVFDPGFAPGVSHYEPGGISPRFFIDFLHNFNADIIGCDIVEYNPLKDINHQTAALVYKLMKEIIGKLHTNTF